MTFSDKVYKLCKQIPKGKVSTYKEIAIALNTKAYRAVGQVLRNNPYAPKVPCHRVVNSKGELHGFQGKTKGKPINKKKQLLIKERITVTNNKIDLEKYLYRFKNEKRKKL